MVFRSFSFPLAFFIPPSVLLQLFCFLTNTLLPSTPPHFSRCTEVNCFCLHEHELGLTYWNRDSLAVAVPPKKNDKRPQHPLTAPCPSVRGDHLETTPHAPWARSMQVSTAAVSSRLCRLYHVYQTPFYSPLPQPLAPALSTPPFPDVIRALG